MNNAEKPIQYISVTTSVDGRRNYIQDVTPPASELKLIYDETTSSVTDAPVPSQETTYNVAPAVSQPTIERRQVINPQLFAATLDAMGSPLNNQPKPNDTPTPPKSNARRATRASTTGNPAEIITVPSHVATAGKDIAAAYPPRQPSSTTQQRPARRATSPEGPPVISQDNRAAQPTQIIPPSPDVTPPTTTLDNLAAPDYPSERRGRIKKLAVTLGHGALWLFEAAIQDSGRTNAAGRRREVARAIDSIENRYLKLYENVARGSEKTRRYGRGILDILLREQVFVTSSSHPLPTRPFTASQSANKPPKHTTLWWKP